MLMRVGASGGVRDRCVQLWFTRRRSSRHLRRGLCGAALRAVRRIWRRLCFIRENTNNSLCWFLKAINYYQPNHHTSMQPSTDHGRSHWQCKASLSQALCIHVHHWVAGLPGADAFACNLPQQWVPGSIDTMHMNTQHTTNAPHPHTHTAREILPFK
jgi:hypothetical protein